MIKENRGTRLIPYTQSLDGLRAIAATAVVVEHIYQDYPWIAIIKPGYFGVRLFFVLSGYLITAILLKGRFFGGNDDRGTFLKSFYIRRTLRVFPIYYITLIVMALTSIYINGLKGYYLWRFAYLTNFHMAIHHTKDVYYGHLWTLAVEEQFYLIWPCLILFTPARYLGSMIVGTVLMAPALRSLTAVGGWDELWISKPTWSTFDSLGMGAMVAFCRASSTAGWLKTATSRFLDYAMIIGVLMILFGFYCINVYGYRSILYNTFFGLGNAIAFAGLVYACTSGSSAWWKAMLGQPYLTDLGKISYGFYLYHAFLMPFVWMILVRVGLSPRYGLLYTTLYFVSVFVLTLLVAAASWHFIEKPLNNLKHRFSYSGTNPLKSPPSS